MSLFKDNQQFSLPTDCVNRIFTSRLTKYAFVQHYVYSYINTFSSKRQCVPCCPLQISYFGGQQNFFSAAPTPSPSNSGRSLRHWVCFHGIESEPGYDGLMMISIYTELFSSHRHTVPSASGDNGGSRILARGVGQYREAETTSE